MFDLNNKVAIVTGASGGLGEAIAEALSKHGARLAILDNKDGGRIVEKLETESKYYQVDVTNEDEIRKVVKTIKRDFSSIDILVNNAGVYYPTPISETDITDWDRLININLRGYFLMAKHCVPEMKEGSRIINVSSVAGHHAFAYSAAYNASKGAIIQLTKTLALDHAAKINVNAICPGIFVTPMTEGLMDGMESTIERSIPLKRAGKAEEIGGLAVYLASDESSYMTGSIITIDGGWTCHL